MPEPRLPFMSLMGIFVADINLVIPSYGWTFYFFCGFAKECCKWSLTKLSSQRINDNERSAGLEGTLCIDKFDIKKGYLGKWTTEADIIFSGSRSI